MFIDAINRIKQIFTHNVAKKEKTVSSQPIKRDTVSISDEAKQMAEMQKATELAKATIKKVPDVREEKIKEVKERLESGYYDRPEVLKEVAKKLGKVLFD